MLCFALKRNETTETNPPRKYPRNAPVISAEELGTMSKNNFRGITLDRRPLWGIHSYLDNLLTKHVWSVIHLEYASVKRGA